MNFYEKYSEFLLTHLFNKDGIEVVGWKWNALNKFWKFNMLYVWSLKFNWLIQTEYNYHSAIFFRIQRKTHMHIYLKKDILQLSVWENMT